MLRGSASDDALGREGMDLVFKGVLVYLPILLRHQKRSRSVNKSCNGSQFVMPSAIAVFVVGHSGSAGCDKRMRASPSLQYPLLPPTCRSFRETLSRRATNSGASARRVPTPVPRFCQDWVGSGAPKPRDRKR